MRWILRMKTGMAEGGKDQADKMESKKTQPLKVLYGCKDRAKTTPRKYETGG